MADEEVVQLTVAREELYALIDYHTKQLNAGSQMRVPSLILNEALRIRNLTFLIEKLAHAPASKEH